MIELSFEIVYSGIIASVFGWGHYHPKIYFSDWLKKLDVRILDDHECSVLLGYVIHHSQMCGVSVNGQAHNFEKVCKSSCNSYDIKRLWFNWTILLSIASKKILLNSLFYFIFAIFSCNVRPFTELDIIEKILHSESTKIKICISQKKIFITIFVKYSIQCEF